jgi:hypothetical protein
MSQQEFIEQARHFTALAQKADCLAEKTTSLWKMESLGFSLLRHSEPGNTLNDPKLPLEAKPITHVGMGGGAVEISLFDPKQIIELIEQYADPNFHWFPYEQLGAMLAMHEPSLFPIDRWLLGLDSLKRPDPEEFIAQFPAEAQRLISHGYGRLLYFKNKNIGAAVAAAMNRPFLQLPAAAQGTAFGYMMVNNPDIYQVLEVGDGLGRPDMVQAFKNGLTFALEFWEWLSPGTLDSLEPTSARQRDLISKAKATAHSQRERGWLDPFDVPR